ncbi:hypothetical protein F3Y22_tig00005465pilonHSYRG00049 [Hibiscus syriacus]|uniref:BED-type domain-containing protein n=1 Tax=Hibiscus syriacus TaxID=106335 RepID=A0A6A3CIP5_HIBSY|nr:hypothetical protein F3Y22_tig00005465pilonHSYRG00049 [Hibiscus syriacus]
MEGQRSIDDNSNARAQSQSQAESNNMTQSSPMPNNQGPSISPIEEEQTQIDYSNVGTNSRKRKLTSVVWNHFEKVNVNGEDKAECRYCKKKLGANSKKGTQHLHDHFKSYPSLLEKNRIKIAITTDMWTSSNKKKVTLMFSGTKYPMANVFFPSICEIRIALNKWSEDRDEVIKAMGEWMLVKFDKYWSVIHGVMGVAVVLDPRYKFKMMEYAFPKIYGFEMFDVEIVKLKELVSHLFQDYETYSYESSRNRDVDSSCNTSDMKIGEYSSESSSSKDVGSANVCPKLVNKRNKRKLMEKDWHPLINSRLEHALDHRLSYAGRLQLVCSDRDTAASGAKVRWQCVCLPNFEGGLGIKDLHCWREAHSFRDILVCREVVLWKVWDEVCSSEVKVNWHKLVWFSLHVPKYAIVAWLAILNREVHSREQEFAWAVNMLRGKSSLVVILKLAWHTFLYLI